MSTESDKKVKRPFNRIYINSPNGYVMICFKEIIDDSPIMIVHCYFYENYVCLNSISTTIETHAIHLNEAKLLQAIHLSTDDDVCHQSDLFTFENDDRLTLPMGSIALEYAREKMFSKTVKKLENLNTVRSNPFILFLGPLEEIQKLEKKIKERYYSSQKITKTLSSY
jgi:hypothetical protein